METRSLSGISSSTTASPPANGAHDSGRCIRRKFHRPPASCMAPRRPRTPMVAATPTPSHSYSSSRPPLATSRAPPTLQATTSPTATPLSFLRAIVSADTPIPHHLVFTTLALLLASGFIVRRLHRKDRYRAPPPTPKGIKKRKQEVVKSILIAQSQEETSNPGSTSVKTRSRSGSLTSTRATRCDVVGSTLLPSPACIVSTSAAIWNNLEKVAAVLASSATRITSHQTAAGTLAVTEKVVESARSSKESGFSSRDGPRKAKSKKGKGAAVNASTFAGQGSGSDMSRTSSKQGKKNEGAETRKIDQGVQVSQVAVETGKWLNAVPTSTDEATSARAIPDTSGRLSPAHSNTPLVAKSNASVQTSPRLLPYRDRTPSPVPSPAPSVPSSPSRRFAAAPSLEAVSPAPIRPIAVPISFDLHASFQATPSSAPEGTREAPRSISPPLSSTPSRSPSISPSVSYGSPTDRQLSSTATSLASTTSSNTRRQSKKAATSGVNGKAIVGLPKSSELARQDDGAEASPISMAKTRVNGKDRPSPIPIPSNSGQHETNSTPNDVTPQPQRRLSTASSSAHSVSNLSLTSSGSPYSIDRSTLPSTAPSMTMTPPEFARRPSSTTSYNRDETLRWPSGSSTSSRGREASLRGLGVDLDRGEMGGFDGDDNGSVETRDGNSRQRGNPHQSSQKPGPQAQHQQQLQQPPLGRHVSYATPESSPHPAPRMLTPFDTPSPTNHPWLQHASSSTSIAASTNTVAYPIASSASPTSLNGTGASRPASRQTSLSVPASAGQAQYMQLQQQQQAYAVVQVQAQAQAAAQYQHNVALQYQAQVQAQSQSHQRRKIGDGISPLEESSQVPNGLVYPLGSSTTANHFNSHSNWPSNLVNPHTVSPVQTLYPHPQLAQAVSPTTANFPGSNTMSSHTQAQMYQSYINQSAAYYLAASSAPSTHATPNHQQQHHQQTPTPSRPRINSSVSAVAVLTGGGGTSNGRNGSVASPISATSLASPRMINVETQRHGSMTNPFSPYGYVAGNSTGTLGDIALAWKTRAKEAEMEADRNAKELEIARWRLSVMEGEQLTNEVENQEALRALATRAMRAEARLKLLEENRKSEGAQLSPSTEALNKSSSASSVTASPKDLQKADSPSNIPVENDWRSFAEGEFSSNGPGSGLHPLSWLELDSISFSTRPLNSSNPPNRPPLNHSFSSSTSSRKRAGRNSNGNGNNAGNGRRQSGTGRRKSSNNSSTQPLLLSPALHLSVPTPVSGESGQSSPSPNRRSRRSHLEGGEEGEQEDEDEEEIVIVLNNMSRRSIRSPSRRSSYTASPIGGDDSLVAGTSGRGGGDASSFIDEDDIPTIEFDSEVPSSQIELVRPHQHRSGNGNCSSDSQNGSIGIDEEEDQVDYVGFLPGFLARIRASSSLATASDTGEPPMLEERREASLEVQQYQPDNAILEEDATTPEARTIGAESAACPFQDKELGPLKLCSPDLAPQLSTSIPLHSTPPRTPATFAFDEPEPGNSERSPLPPLYHPFPMRPSQIALPPSPTLVTSPSPFST